MIIDIPGRLKFYVYAYLRIDGSPYYIGKGAGKRAYQRHSGFYPPDRSRIVFLETNLSEIGSYALERRYIRWYGRKDNKTGILHNKTDGGIGGPGAVRSEQTRKKMSESKKRTPRLYAWKETYSGSTKKEIGIYAWQE